jgi:hypothetical protein
VERNYLWGLVAVGIGVGLAILLIPKTEPVSMERPPPRPEASPIERPAPDFALEDPVAVDAPEPEARPVSPDPRPLTERLGRSVSGRVGALAPDTPEATRSEVFAAERALIAEIRARTTNTQVTTNLADIEAAIGAIERGEMHPVDAAYAAKASEGTK